MWRHILIILSILFVSVPTFAAPVILYTNITSGPNTGGEDNYGVYLSIYGTGFGTSQGSSTVEINGTEVAAYKYWGTAQIGRPNIQQISVQPGSSVTTGAIEIIVSGTSSNLDHTFTVRSGTVYFVDENDVNCVTTGGGTITVPRCAIDDMMEDMSAGDVAVLRGGTWDSYKDNTDNWVRINSGNGGTQADPIMVMGYPGETVQMSHPDGIRGFYWFNSGVDGFSISNIKLDTSPVSGSNRCIAFSGQYLRIVAIDCTGHWGTGSGSGAFSGEIGNGAILGNVIHDNGATKLYHAIYIQNNGDYAWVDNVEIAYNHIYNQTGGTGIQVYSGVDNTEDFDNYYIHDNYIHDVDRYGIAGSTQCGNGFEIYNNLIHDAGINSPAYYGGGLRCGMKGYKCYNNTIYNVENAIEIGGGDGSGGEVKNNIFDIGPSGTRYLDPGTSWSNSPVCDTNIWNGAGAGPANCSNNINDDPDFVDTSSDDFHIQSASPAKDAGLTLSWTKGDMERDFDTLVRPQGSAWDVGALEYGTLTTNIGPAGTFTFSRGTIQ